ncbi:MAG: DEAD/DEAH box helicase [Oscillospiraceae bacterium]
MTQFTELELTPELERAVAELGFLDATAIQAAAIPVIRQGIDVTARSQTGTGKTLAFAIPAIERIDPKENAIQVLILCPTRELAQQAADEVSKLSRYAVGVRQTVICGGADMDRQFIQLRRANLVIGTPGRIMDHMRRGTIKLESLKLLVLDEADEMLDMGFKEDIETILRDTPIQRQTVLFSATLPPDILKIAAEFQHEPQRIEGEQSEQMVANITHSYVDAPAGHKTDALTLLLRYHRPNRAILFCNTKSMVDELTEHLNAVGFMAEGLHGDMKQAQRTHVMNGFKKGKISILVATDIAARGIDVSDVDYVINYDIPKVDDYYIHRIGRTGRAGKSGLAITICCGRRQTTLMRNLCRRIRAEISEERLPTPEDIRVCDSQRDLETVKTALGGEIHAAYSAMVVTLMEQDFSAEEIAAAALQLHFEQNAADDLSLPTIAQQPLQPGSVRKTMGGRQSPFADVVVDIGSAGRVAPNHLVGAITERSGLSGKQIGKIEISQEFSVVGVPADAVDKVCASMAGCKICGRPTHTKPLSDIRLRRREDGKHRSDRRN